MKYNVLWFDDEFEQLDNIREEAHLSGITLHGFSNAEEGLRELNVNLDHYDAVLLDGIFYLKAEESGDITLSQSTDAFNMVAQRLNQILAGRQVPCFILSGQPSFKHEKQPFTALINNPRVYDKLSPEDLNELWEEIKKQADDEIFTQIRHEFPEIFEACSDSFIGSGHAETFLKILQQIKKPNTQFSYSSFYTDLRQVLEGLFKKMVEAGINHEKCLDKGKLNLSGSSLFLAGHHVENLNIKRSEPVFPKEIAEAVKNLIFLTNNAVHNDKSVESAIDFTSPYLLYSATFQLAEVLRWSNAYYDQHPDYEKNKSNWIDTGETISGDWIEVQVSNIHENGFLTLKRSDGKPDLSLPPKIYNPQITDEIEVGDILLVTIKPVDNSNKLHIDLVRRCIDSTL